MQLISIIVGLAITSTGLASVLNLNIYTDGESTPIDLDGYHDQVILATSNDEEPGWRKRDNGNLVRLHPAARTGVLPVEVEEALIHTVGPRFANEFIKAAAESAGNGVHIEGSCPFLQCAGTVIKGAPFLAKAMASDDVGQLSKSPVDLCPCKACLPDAIKPLLDTLESCDDSVSRQDEFAADEKNREFDYAEYLSFSLREPRLLALRGDIRRLFVQEAADLAAQGYCSFNKCDNCGCCLTDCVGGYCPSDVCVEPSSDSTQGKDEL